MRKYIKRALPQAWLDALYVKRMQRRTRREFRADAKRYLRFATPGDRVLSWSMPESYVTTQAIKDYHRLEKGLALASPKRPFGAAVEGRLRKLVPHLDEGSDLHHAVTTSLEALDSWNASGSIDEEVSPVGLPPISWPRESIRDFFYSRHSVRNFDPNRTISVDDLFVAAEFAGRSPSVCNRQAWRLRLAVDATSVEHLLRHQRGNRGIDNIPALALVTVDSRLFSGSTERNQGWIDGGLYSMSFAWALHGLGIASCMLNMSLDNDASDRLRTEFQIPDNELIVMQIAIGYPRESHRYARSPRKSLSETVSVISTSRHPT